MMEETILRVRFPKGQLPARGFRCPVCHDERLLLEEAHHLDELAHELGLFGVENQHRRKLLRTGNSLAVTIDPDLIRDILDGATAGEEVRVGRMGRKIVIEPV